MTERQTSTTDTAARAEACANGECVHAHLGKDAARVAGEYRYGVEHALDYIDNRDGITPEVAATLRSILTRAIETPAPVV
jgi:hypothetical protein